jgi:hypothetical protein
MTKVLIHIFVEDKTFTEAEALRAKIEAFLTTEPDAKLLTFSYTEEGE